MTWLIRIFLTGLVGALVAVVVVALGSLLPPQWQAVALAGAFFGIIGGVIWALVSDA